MKVKNIFLMIKTICIHKYYVAKFCFLCGLYWRGIKHDMSKFSLTELKESVKFYTGKETPIKKAKEIQGYSLAWLHHKGRNTHHHEYWCDNFDNGKSVTSFIMPLDDIIEMMCDWFAAYCTYNNTNKINIIDEYNWWQRKKKDSKEINPKIVLFIDRLFFQFLKNGDISVLKNRGFLEKLYKEIING